MANCRYLWSEGKRGELIKVYRSFKHSEWRLADKGVKPKGAKLDVGEKSRSYLRQIKRTAFFCMDSSFAMSDALCGFHTTQPYSSNGRTNVLNVKSLVSFGATRRTRCK